MDIYQIILVPLAFGLLGFVEPCSIGANIIFFGYVKSRASNKVMEALKFTLSRALFLGLVGSAVGFLGQPLRLGAYSYSLLLGVLYVILGLVGFSWNYWGRGFSSLDVGRYLPKEGALPLGVIFGLSAPACSLPLFLALIGLSAIKGAAIGFLTLFLFGLALSAPLIWIVRSEKAEEILRRLGNVAFKVPYFAELLLVLVGAGTIFIAWRQLSTI